MNTFAIIVMILIVLMLIVVVSWFFDKSKKISGFRDATKQKTVVNKISTGNEYSGAYAIWIHVSDWSTYNGVEKVIFNAGGEDGLEVSLGATSPELIVNHGAIDTIVPDIPLQTWVCIVISISTNALDIYINGKLVKTDTTSSINYSTSEIVLSPGTTDGEDGVGFSGYTNGFKYYTSSLSPSEVWNIYRKGPGGTILGNLFGDRSVKLDILKGSDVTSSFKF